MGLIPGATSRRPNRIRAMSTDDARGKKKEMAVEYVAWRGDIAT